jgi:hypothetical protein
MIFSELYGAYYNSVAKILTTALKAPVDMTDIRRIAEETAFSESSVAIETAFKEEKWQLLCGGAAIVKHKPNMPITTLQRRWLKAVLLDRRIRLFDVDISGLDDVEPLFTPDMVYVFDRYADGDNYADEGYIKSFRLILDAVKKQYSLRIAMLNRAEREIYKTVKPLYLEYSEKDDKFRLIAVGRHCREIINLGRITACEPYYGKTNDCLPAERTAETKSVIVELTDERNSLERVMLHFAHFEKRAERVDDKRYRVKINYNREDETEIVIRILSFGPLVRVLEPQGFVELIRERLKMQLECGL